MRKALNIFSTILVILAVLFAFLVLGIKLFGWQLYVVLSGSMEPTFQTGSVVYVKPVTPEEVQVNDIITFSMDDGMLATHRVVEIVEEGTGRSFRTKGDANDVVDGRLVADSQLVGKALFSIPKMGRVVEFIHTDKGRIVAIGAGLLLVLLVALPDLLFPKKKKKDADQAQQDEKKA